MSENELAVRLKSVSDLYQAMGYVGDSAAELARLMKSFNADSAEVLARFTDAMSSLVDQKSIDRQRARDDLQRKRQMARGKGNLHWRRSASQRAARNLTP